MTWASFAVSVFLAHHAYFAFAAPNESVSSLAALEGEITLARNSEPLSASVQIARVYDAGQLPLRPTPSIRNFPKETSPVFLSRYEPPAGGRFVTTSDPNNGSAAPAAVEKEPEPEPSWIEQHGYTWTKDSWNSPNFLGKPAALVTAVVETLILGLVYAGIVAVALFVLVFG